jgi:hypothetical protein
MASCQCHPELTASCPRSRCGGDWQRRRAGTDGSGSLGRQTLGRNEDGLASLCFAACQHTTCGDGLYLRTRAASVLSRADSALSPALARMARQATRVV